MSREVAQIVIDGKLRDLRKVSYDELVKRMKHPVSEFVDGPDGEKYQLETQVFWDSTKGGNVRVMVSADGGGISAFLPMSGDFILSPEGSFIGEGPG